MCSECQSPVWRCCQNKSNVIIILLNNMHGSCLRHVDHFINAFIYLLCEVKSRFSLSMSHGEVGEMVWWTEPWTGSNWPWPHWSSCGQKLAYLSVRFLLYDMRVSIDDFFLKYMFWFILEKMKGRRRERKISTREKHQLLSPACPSPPPPRGLSQ